MDYELIYGVFVVPLIMGLVELVKGYGLSEKNAALLALALGIIISMSYNLVEFKWEGATNQAIARVIFKGLITGTALGLSASGLYSTQKVLRGK